MKEGSVLLMYKEELVMREVSVRVSIIVLEGIIIKWLQREVLLGELS